MATACELCGGTQREPFLAGSDKQHGVPGTWQLARCSGCGLVGIDPLPAAEAIAGFYPDADYYAHRASPATFRRIELSRTKRFVLRHRYGYPLPAPARNPLARLLAWPASLLVSRKHLLPWCGEGRLLDVGCGVGSALWRLRAYGWTVQGLEIDDAAAAVGRQHGLPIRTGTLEDCGFAAESFDLVRMSHVLEHARSPLQTLRAARRLLVPGGELLLMLPNLGSFGFRRFRHNWFPLELPRHLWHFTPATLRRLCTAAGFGQVRIRCRSTAEMWMRSWQYARVERAARRGAALAGLPMPQRRWLKRLVALPVWCADRRGVGDLMDCTATRT